MMLRLFVVFFALFFTLTTFAQIPDDIEIAGDEIFYTKNNQVLNVSGNVTLAYESYQVLADEFYYDLEQNVIHFPKKFSFVQKDEAIKGTNLFYDGQRSIGSAQNIDANFYGVTVKGKSLAIKKDKFVLEDTYCTSCKDGKGYYVSSKSMEMYYVLGMLIARNSAVSLDFLPFKFPVPFFIYGDSKLGVMEETNVFPEIGSNLSEGNYLKQRFSYILNPSLAGSVQFSLTSTLGSFFGGNTRYFFNNNVAINSSYFYSFNDQDLTGKIQLSILPVAVFSSPNGLFSSLMNKLPMDNGNKMKVDLIYQYKLLVNDEFVNYSPLLQFKMDKFKLSNSFNVDVDINASYVGEFQADQLLELGRLKYKKILRFSQSITDLLIFNAVTFLDVNLYGNDTNWRRGFQSVGLAVKSFLNPEIGFNKRLFSAGQSPFNHELNYAILSDEINFSFSQEWKRYLFKNQNFYNVNDQEFRDSVWEFDILFDCWKVGLGWKLANEQFYFRFELL